MKLRDLLGSLNPKVFEGDRDIPVNGVTYDSRSVESGSIFVALKGGRQDGHSFIGDAVARGAVAVLAEKYIPGLCVAQIVVGDTRVGIAKLSDAFYAHPSEELTIVGVTGTNGKTTTTYILESIFKSAGLSAGVIGTVDYRFEGNTIKAVNTTPEAPHISKLLRDMVDAGVTHCAMEVSSHALDQRRVDGISLEVAVFTNLTRDHLDYHRTMEEYFASKRRLFEEILGNGGVAIINIDDGWGERLAGDLNGTTVIRYGVKNRGADIRPLNLLASESGLEAGLATPAGDINISSSLLGEYNLMNIMASVGAAVALNLGKPDIKAGVRKAGRIPGRLEMVASAAGVRAFVDYAHTPDALRRALNVINMVSRRRVITVFGCGGDRDREKRPVMGGHAVRFSDVAIITSDNPRGEDPLDIIKDIESGIDGVVRCDHYHTAPARFYTVIPDRGEAIRTAVALAVDGDVILVAGKGHEDYQIIGDKRIPFDDRRVLREVMEEGKGEVALSELI